MARILTISTACALTWTGIHAQEAPEADSVDRDYSAELPRIEPLEPAEALASFEIHPGFRMDQVAAEPLVRDPIAMAFDEDGRLYVVEMRGYSEEKDDLLSAIRLLEDTNGDGRFDAGTLFLEGLEWPTAIFCWKGGVFIGVPPDILYAKDTTGDGRADAIETVYTGFSLANVQGMMNTLTWGLDNRIHGATSSSGAEVRPGSDPAAPPIVLRGRDFSFDPRTGAFQPESGGGQHGLSFDAWGRKFTCHNSDQVQFMAFEDRYVARNPYFAAPNPRISVASDGPAGDVFRISPVEPWRILRTRLRVQGIVPGPIEGGGRPAGYFTSATGITVYKGDAWPEPYQGNIIVADVGSNLIHRKRVEQNGVELVAHRADPDTEFIRSSDIWFRPVQFALGPDGALYVADMYREVIEHPDSLPPVIKQHLDLTSGRDRGRIYRIVPDTFEQPPLPRLSNASTPSLVPLLEHPNAWWRETAARLIYERQDTAIVPMLEALASESSSPLGRMHALYALDGLESLTVKALVVALNDAHPRVREHAVRLTERVANPLLAGRVAALANDPDIRVRYQVAFTLGSTPTHERGSALADLVRNDGADRWFRVAIMTSLAGGAEGLFTELMLDESFRTSPSGRRYIEELAFQVGTTSRDEELAAILEAIDKMPEAEQSLAENALRGLIHGLRTGNQAAHAREVLARSPRATNMLGDMLSRANEAALDAALPPADRAEAVRLLALAPLDATVDTLRALLDARQPAPVQEAALASVSQYDNAEAVDVVIDAWPGFAPGLRSRGLEAFFAKRTWLNAMLDAMEADRLAPASLDPLRTEMLRAHNDPGIRDRALRLLGEQTSDRQAVVEAYRPALDLSGDAARGKTIFAENCSQCHLAQGIGHEVGPDLATVAQAGAEKLLQNILDPNSEVNPQYYNYIIETTDWDEHSGIIASETATSITLKRPHGDTETLLRVNIERVTTNNQSLMPEGWEDAIDHQAMADLIAYLTSIE